MSNSSASIHDDQIKIDIDEENKDISDLLKSNSSFNVHFILIS